MFLDSGILIQRSAFVNPFMLGLTHQTTLLSLPLESQKYYSNFRDLLARSEESVAIIEHGGNRQIEVRTYTRGPSHLQHFFDSLATTFAHPFHIQESLTILEHEYPGISSPDLASRKRPPLGYAPLPDGSMAVKLEERDHAILSALCNSKYLSWNQVARELSMPTSTLTYRIANLEKSGVIQGHYYVRDVTVFKDLPILLQVLSRALKAEERLAIKKFCRIHPKVAWMSMFLGSQSAEMLVIVQNYDEARSVISDFSTHFAGSIDSVQMTAPLKFFKWSDYPFRNYETLVGS
jgi:DNA-binding Lrp family transcriptional regulator